MRRFSLLALLLAPLPLVAGVPPETAALDRANEALAAGRADEAIGLLRAALPKVTDPTGQARVRCALGAAALAADQPKLARDVLAEVPLDQVCGTRAAFLRASAIERLGDSAGAAALTAEVGASFLGDDRDGRTVEATLPIARKLSADPDRGAETGRRLIVALLGMQISTERAAGLARELVRDLDLSDGLETRPIPEACGALLVQLRSAESRDDRLAAARVCDAAVGQRLLDGLPADDADAIWARAALSDPHGQVALARASLAAAPNDARRTALAHTLEAANDLGAVALLREAGSADALFAAAQLARNAGDDALALELLRSHLARFPTDAARVDVQSELGRTLLDLARSHVAAGRLEPGLQTFEALLADVPDHPVAADAAYESALVLRALGRPADARQRWHEAIARFPEVAGRAYAALARMKAFDDHDPEGAIDALRSIDPAGERARLEEESLWVSAASTGSRQPVVRVGTRNLETVELRLHTVDLEAYVRSGGYLDQLPALDVAPIAPDRSWTAEVPGYARYRDIAFDVPVPVREPGLYAVTAASSGQEARALLLVSDLSVVARVVGEDVAVATFDASGRPVGGARVILPDSDEGRTDASGLWTGRLPTTGNTRLVLAEHRGSWAITEFPVDVYYPQEPLPVAVTAEVDRPIYLPGDEVAFRAVARDARGRPVTGTWQVWVDGSAPIELQSDARGILTGTVRAPESARYAGDLPISVTHHLSAVPPGSAEQVFLGGFEVAPADTGGRTLTVSLDGADAVARVRGRLGEPVADVPLRWDGGAGRTDPRGELRISGPSETLPWAGTVWVDGGLSAPFVRQGPSPLSLSLDLDQPVVRTTERAAVTALVRDDSGTGRTGRAAFVLYREVEFAPAPEPVRDPWIEEPVVGVRGPQTWSGPAPAPQVVALEPVWEQAQEVASTAAIPLPALARGRYRLVGTLPGGVGSASIGFVVDDAALRLVGARDVGLGDVVSVAPQGSAALLTAESDRLLWAAVRLDGREVRVPTDGWRGTVQLAATSPAGQVAVTEIDADPSLRVAIEAVPDGDGAEIRATVRTSTGAPVAANVSITAWDERLADAVGGPQGLVAWSVDSPAPQAGGVGRELFDAAVGVPIAPALLAEVQREKERLKALQAADGLLSDNALAEAMLGDVPIALGGLGSVGYGAGGGGGIGMGVAGGSLGRVGQVRASGRAIPGVRERVLWKVADVAAAGTLAARLAGPPATYRVRVSAVAAGALGTAELEVDLSRRAWLVAHAPVAGRAEDRATPWVTVVNGTDGELRGPLVAGEARVELALAPHTAATLAVGSAVGPSADPVPVAWDVAGRPTVSWAFPLAAGAPAADGPLVVSAGGVAAVVTRPDPSLARHPERSATAGRAALAALAANRDRSVASAALAAWDRYLSEGAPESATTASEGLLFAVEARAAGIDRSRTPLALGGPAPTTAVERALVLRAYRAAGLPVDPNLSALVDEDARTSSDVAALRTLSDPRAPVIGTLDPSTPWGAAASLAVGRPVDVEALIRRGPPEPGEPGLAEWVSVARTAPGAVRDGPVGVRVERGPAQGPWRWPAAEPPTPTRGLDLAVRPESPAGRADLVEIEAAPCDPCVVSVGDTLDPMFRSDLIPVPGALPLRWVDERHFRWHAVAPGSYRVAAREADSGEVVGFTVEVRPDRAGVTYDPEVRLAWDARAIEHGGSPELAGYPEPFAPRVASLAFRSALNRGDPAAIASSFRLLVATDPSASVSLSELASAARALASTGQPAAAVRAWRAGLDAAFAAEAASIQRLEPTGELLAIQKVREAALRYPDGPRVADALYLLPARLLEMAGGLPEEVVTAGITSTDVRLTAAAWDRELLAAYPHHPRATAAGMRLGRVLLTLGAADAAADWAARVGAAHPDEEASDGLVFLEALARTEAGDAARAEPLLNRLVSRPFPSPDGTIAPSVHRSDALLVLGRLYESRGQLDRAIGAYEQASGSDEAQRALDVLGRTSLSVPPVVMLRTSEPARLPIDLSNVDEVRIRAYAVDLRTLFLRDLGLSGATDIAVAGVSPAWAGARRTAGGAYVTRDEVPLPLAGAGAWVVQVEGAGITASTLVVRSGLELSSVDAGEARRITLRRGGRPAQGVEVRALLATQEVVRAVTDVRGVAEVPAGASVLAWAGDDWAFTDPQEQVWATSAPSGGYEPLLQLLDQRIDGQQSEDASEYRRAFDEASGAVELNAL